MSNSFLNDALRAVAGAVAVAVALKAMDKFEVARKLELWFEDQLGPTKVTVDAEAAALQVVSTFRPDLPADTRSGVARELAAWGRAVRPEAISDADRAELNEAVSAALSADYVATAG